MKPALATACALIVCAVAAVVAPCTPEAHAIPHVLPLVEAASATAVAPPPQPALVPEASARYRHAVEQAVAEVWGITGSPARLAAQMHAESNWRIGARSPVGAQGMAQFMPATARWIAREFPARLGTFDPWDPAQAVLAAAIYDHYLLQRNPGATPCDSWSFALSAYNGGERALRAEQRLAQANDRARTRWQGDVEKQRARSMSAWRENRGYVHRILYVLEPLYLRAGWSGEAVCA